MRDKLSKNQIKGILCIVMAGIGFSLMTFFVRLSGDLPTMQKAFFRNAFALVIAAAMLPLKGIGFELKKEYAADILFRCLFGTTALIANFYAVDRLVLADANMLNKLSPFFAILLSIPLLKERPSRGDIAATLIAFAGALFIIRPTPGNMELVPALLGLYGGFGAGTAYVFLRRATRKGAPAPIIVFCFSLFSCLLTLPFMIAGYVPMSPEQLALLIAAGMAGALGQFSITAAYKFAPAKKLSVFDYTQVLFAALWGVLFLHEVPTAWSILGYGIIIGIAVVRWRRAFLSEDDG